MSESTAKAMQLRIKSEIQHYSELMTLLKSEQLRDFQYPKIVRMALAESAILHTRQLIDIFLNRGYRDNDLNLNKILSPADYPVQALQRLNELYHDVSNGMSAAFEISNHFAHPSLKIDVKHDYWPILLRLEPALQAVIDQLSLQQWLAADGKGMLSAKEGAMN